MAIVRDYRSLLATSVYPAARWNYGESMGNPVVITYDFADLDTLTTAELPYSASSVSKMTSAQRSNVRLALEEFSAVTGLFFVEVKSGGMFRFHNAHGSDWGGWADYPTTWTGGYLASDIVVDNSGSYGRGSYAFTTILHEVGHALGLKHPHDGNPQLDDNLDSTRNTVMSYNFVNASTSLEWLDVDALTHLYGSDRRTDDWTVRTFGEFADGSEAPGSIELTLSARSDRLVGLHEATIVRAGGGNDRIIGRDANDRFYGDAGDDRLYGRGGADLLLGGYGDDYLDGDGGDDDLRGGAGHDELRGDSGDDVLNGGSGNDLLLGGYGNDDMEGLFGHDQLIGSRGNDRLSGGSGNDRLSGNDDDDRLYGGTGNDRLYGGTGDDVLYGNSGNDTLVGWEGSDILSGAHGDDLLIGGPGADVFVFATAQSGTDVIRDFVLGYDEIDISRSGFGWEDARFSSASSYAQIDFAGADDFVIRLEGVSEAALASYYLVA